MICRICDDDVVLKEEKVFLFNNGRIFLIYHKLKYYTKLNFSLCSKVVYLP